MSARSSYSSGARFVPATCNRKLALVGRPLRPNGKKGLVALAPFVSITDVSIAGTCSDSCPFKLAGCYQEAGLTGKIAAKLDAAGKGFTADEVIASEVRLIDAAFRGRRIPDNGAGGARDLRLHVGGDVGSTRGAQLLAGAALRWKKRGGGTPWTFTHRWREVPRDAWGLVSVLASVERSEDIGVAREAGYASAIVVPAFRSEKAFALPGTSAAIIPCPAETTGVTCVECRLCLDADKLAFLNKAIAFEAHGPGSATVRETLIQLRRPQEPAKTRDKNKGATPPGKAA